MEIEGEDQKLSLHQDLESNSLRGYTYLQTPFYTHTKKKISTLFHVGYLSQTLLNSLFFD